MGTGQVEHDLFATPADRFEEWLRAPAPLESTHPEFDCRRARPEEFDAIYDLIDESFEFKRARPLYDWLYRRNPYGLARCWVVIDRTSGRYIGNAASWPWPIARSSEPMEGVLAGDTVIAPRWQRRGIIAMCIDARRSHPWQRAIPGLSWANEKSRGSGIKRGRGALVLGPVPRTTLSLRTGEVLAGRRWPGLLSHPVGAVCDTALDLWRTALLRGRRNWTIDAVRRFDSSFNEVTRGCMAWPDFWSPHGADFLNWRYFDRPVGEYHAFALSDGDQLAGYAVLKIESDSAWLMEFAVPTAPRRLGASLLLHIIRVARAAGCASVRFTASPGWRHWRLLRTASFLPTRSEIYLWPAGPDEAFQLNAWQWTPGDMDDL